MIWQTLALFVVSFVLTALLTPKPQFENARASTLDDVDFPRATENAPIPFILGRVRMSAPNTLWYGDFSSRKITERIKTGYFSSKKVTVGHKYNVGLDMALGLGPGCDLHEIYIDETLCWEGDTGGVTEFSDYIRKPSIFGGHKSGGGWVGPFTFYNGDFTQTVNTYVQDQADIGDIPAYRGVSHIVFNNNYIGESATLRSMAFVMSRYTNDLELNDDGRIGDYDINPAEALYQVMTNPWSGLGIDVSEIDILSFQQAGEVLRTEGNGASIIVTADTEGNTVLNELLRQIDGVMYQDPETGLVTLRLIREDYDKDALPIYDKDDIVDVRSFTRSSWDEVRAQIKVTYPQRDSDSDAVAVAQDMAVVATLGKNTTNTIAFPLIYDEDLATTVAARELSQLSIPLFRATLEFNRNANTLRPGSVFKLTWPNYQIEELVMRVQRFDLGELANGKIVAECIQDQFAVADVVFAAPEGTYWTEVITQPSPVVTADVVQMPRFFNHKLEFPVGSSNLDFIPLAAKPSDISEEFNCFLVKTGAGQTIDDGETVREAVEYKGTGTLDVAYSRDEGFVTGIDSATGLILTGVEGEFTDASSSEIINDYLNIIYVNGEWMAFETATDNTGGSWTLTNVYRGLFGSQIKDHEIGDRVWSVPIEAFGEGFIDDLVAGEEFTIYFQDSAAGITQDPTESTLAAVTFSDTVLDKPLRPAGLAMAGTRSLGYVVNDQVARTLSWRRRTWETFSVLTETDDSVDPNETISYKIDIMVNGIRNSTLSGTSGPGASGYSIPFNLTDINSTDVEARVWAVNDDTLEESEYYATFPFELDQS